MNVSQPAAAWSGFLKGISIAVTLLLLAAAVLVAFTVPAHPWPLLRIAAGALPLVILLASALFVVRGYALHDDALHVQRLLWITTVPLDSLREARIDPDAGRGSIRLLGNGGLFAFCGWFRNASLGRYRAFVTDWQHAVVLRSATLTVVVSPADPRGFVEALRPASAPAPAAKLLPRWRQSRH